MSNNNSIRFSLNIKDKNIKFEKDWCKKEEIKGIFSIVYYAKLTYKPKQCEKCGAIHSKIVKNGFKTSKIIIPPVSNCIAYLKLKKQRFLCRECGETFIAKTDLIADNCFISLNTKLAIVVDAQNKISEKDIAHKFNVSSNTVNRVLDKFTTNYEADKEKLPEVICFDEFRSVKNISGAMSFVFCDGVSHKIIDIVENRQLTELKKYFLKYSIEARKSVKLIVIDMYTPYMTLIKELFPNAKISIDRFHLVQLLSRAFNKTRIDIMNKYKTKDESLYNKFKKYWRLLMKDYTELSHERTYYHRCFKQYISDKEIVDYLLEKNEELLIAHTIYQRLYYCIKKRNFKAFKLDLKEYSKKTFTHLKISLKTLESYLPFIENSLKYEYSNGPLEGINNKIKVIKRIAFGYKNFENLRRRILLCNDLIGLKKVAVA